MNRRQLYQWVVRAMGAAVAAVVAIPGVRYLIDPLHRRGTSTDLYKRVARLDELESGTPKEVVVTGTRIDAWTVYRDEVVGRVWLTLDSPADESPEKAKVTAFTAVCPHEGCIVQLSLGGDQYVCPCHQAGFSLSGERLTEEDLGRKNASPRDLDTLKSRVVLDESTDQWWVEVMYQNFRQATDVKEPLEG